jgi:hypothetical protein
MSTRVVRVLTLATVLVVGVAGACGGGGGGEGGGEGDAGGRAATTTPSGTGGKGEIAAQVANYELVAGRKQRFLTGLVSGKGTVVSFGSVDVGFSYLGTKDAPVEAPQPAFTTTAEFLPIAGQTGTGKSGGGKEGPRVVRPSEGVGVYKADGVEFDDAGYWRARVTAKIGGDDVRADTVFEVVASPRIPAPGMPAPRTENPTVSTAAGDGAHDPSLDSRANADTALPDPELHSTTIAAAIAARQPLVVVVSTPVYCVSRFCGPLTDSVAALANGKYKGKAAFVHLEVWKDFEAKELNAAAAEWIRLPGGDGQEPWVFTVGRDGVIADRFDNVASDAELDAAVARIVAG